MLPTLQAYWKGWKKKTCRQGNIKGFRSHIPALQSGIEAGGGGHILLLGGGGQRWCSSNHTFPENF